MGRGVGAGTAGPLDSRGVVDAIRRFNRFYTRQIGVLREGFLKSPYSLAQVRVLYEIAHRDKPTATELGKGLGLDAGYLSRILRGFQKQGLLDKHPSETDGREMLLWLTKKGQEAFATLNARQSEEIRALVGHLPAPEQSRLIDAMHAIEGLLAAPPERAVPYILRPHRPGDMGWVVHRHGIL